MNAAFAAFFKLISIDIQDDQVVYFPQKESPHQTCTLSPSSLLISHPLINHSNKSPTSMIKNPPPTKGKTIPLLSSSTCGPVYDDSGRFSYVGGMGMRVSALAETERISFVAAAVTFADAVVGEGCQSLLSKKLVMATIL